MPSRVVAKPRYAKRSVRSSRALPRAIPRSIPQKRMHGRGAYYVSGGAFARGNVGVAKLGAAINAGYSKGQVSAPVLAGLGAYHISNIKHNVLIKPELPHVYNAVYAEGGTIVRHREYLGPITTSATAGAFKIQSYPLNPAQDTTFPWLSSIAQNFEEYRPNGLMFEFRSTASDAIASSTNLALGQLMMCTQYDPTDPEFTSDDELLNYSWAQSGKVSDCVHHFVECDPRQSPLSHLYTRQGSSGNPSDLRFSDFGRFSIASSGLQGTSVQIGQLWCTYEFILYKPKLGGSGAEAGGWFHYHENSATITNTQPLGTIADGIYDAENNLDVLLVDNGNYVDISFPAAFQPTTYEIIAAYTGDSTASVTAPTFGNTVDPDCVFVQHVDGNSSAQLQAPTSAATCASSMCMAWISVPGDGIRHVVKLAAGTMMVSPAVDLYISQIPYLDPSLY